MSPSLSPSFDRRSIPGGATESFWHAADGWKIRRFDWRAAGGESNCRGSILFLPGRGDIYEKYLETLAHFQGLGWNLTASDWRGQGGSGRLGPTPYIGHIDDFSIWVDDLAWFFARWKASMPGPHIVMAHSMGGHNVMRALIDHRIDPDAAVLSAPMLGMSGVPLPLPVLQWIARLMLKIGDPMRGAWKVSEKPASPLAVRQKLLTHDNDRYADELFWWGMRPELVMGPGSWKWVERAYASARYIQRRGTYENVDIPVYIVATSADELVDFGAIEDAVKRLPNAAMLVFGDEAAHEVLREVDEVRDRALAAIDQFLTEAAPRNA